MKKKLTLYEIETLVRTLTTTVIDTLTIEQQNILDSLPNSKELEDLEKEYFEYKAIEEEALNKRRALAKKIGLPLSNSENYVLDYFVKQQKEYKLSRVSLPKIPTQQELKDLIILNSNLELQEIVDKITGMYIN